MAVTVISNDYRNQIGKRLTNKIGIALENGELELYELPNVCEAILAEIDTITSHEQLVAFLQKLSAQWPFFQETADATVHQDQTIEQIERVFSARAKAR